MDQATLRAAAALIVISLTAWLALRNAVLRRQGVQVSAIGQRGNFKQLILVLGAAVLDIYMVFRWPFPVLDEWVRAAASPAPLAALAIMVVGAVLIVAAQGGMGKSWRVGVPAGAGDIDKLVTGGLNRFSRNPVYVAIMIFLTGAAIAAPGPLTVGAIVISFLGLTMIIDSEEKYLRQRFGQEYEDYARRVRRWI